MRASEQKQTGGTGISEVSAKFQRIGWGPIPNDAHDLGTDLLVQARDRRRFDRGLIVGAQVKAGPSWFQNEVRGEQGEITGWWYYEPEAAHFDDWSHMVFRTCLYSTTSIAMFPTGYTSPPKASSARGRAAKSSYRVSRPSMRNILTNSSSSRPNRRPPPASRARPSQHQRTPSRLADAFDTGCLPPGLWRLIETSGTGNR